MPLRRYTRVKRQRAQTDQTIMTPALSALLKAEQRLTRGLAHNQIDKRGRRQKLRDLVDRRTHRRRLPAA